MAQQGLINNGASSQCYCDANHAQGNTGTTRVNSQPADTVFQGSLPISPESDIISTIKTIVNELSNTLSFARASSNSGSQAENVTQNTGANNTTGNDSTDQANNEGLDDFIISLIEQLLATLEGLMGGGENNSENNPPASGNNPSTPTTPVILPIDPSIILDNSVANESDGEVSNYDEMTPAEQKLVAQLYELITFMTDVGNNLEATGNDRISSLIGYLDQQLDEDWHRSRHDNMLYALIQFLERYKDR